MLFRSPFTKTRIYTGAKSRKQRSSALWPVSNLSPPSPFSSSRRVPSTSPPCASAMAQHGFLSSLRSHLRSPPPPSHTQPRRGHHVELGAREKALLEEDVALKRFKSYKNSVKRVSKIGNVLTLVVFAACSYEVVALATSTQ